MPDEVRAEIGPYFIDSAPIVDEDSRKLPKLDEVTADYVRKGLTVSFSSQNTFLSIWFGSLHLC